MHSKDRNLYRSAYGLSGDTRGFSEPQSDDYVRHRICGSVWPGSSAVQDARTRESSVYHSGGAIAVDRRANHE